MSNIMTIFRREFAAYFNVPIAYIFIVVFLAVNSGLFMTSFFLAGTADMRGFFALLPITLIIFIPAITMRLWSEDSKGGTIALLQSFPITPGHLVLGKFLASYLFYLITLASTMVIPIMIMFLGNPDLGPIIGGYFGAALLGAFYLSIGLFISSLFKDQIIAFILSMVACFVFYMVGTDYISIILDGWVSGLGSGLMATVGTANHFSSIERGVLDIRDIIYFISYTSLFLWLNSVIVEQVMRRLADKRFIANAFVGLAVIFMVNLVVGGMNFGRFDLTDGNIYTVSPASKNILRKLKDAPVTIRYYVSPKQKMPAAMKNIEQDVTDMLREFELVSDQVKFEVIDPTSDVDVTSKLEEKGIMPFDARSIEKDSFGIKRIFSALAVSYLDKPEEVLPQVVPQNLAGLEYELLSRIFRMTMETKPTVVLMAPYDVSQQDPRMQQYMRNMGQEVPEKEDRYKQIAQLLSRENYNVIRTELTEADPLPAEYDLLIVLSPRSLSDRQRYEINKALVSGKNVVMGVQNYKFDYAPQRGGGLRVTPNPTKPVVNDLLSHYGVTVNDDILMDNNQEMLSVPTQRNIGGLFNATVDTPVKLPVQIKITDQNMNPDISITNRVSALLYLWGSGLEADKAKLAELGLEHQILFESSPTTWTIPFGGTPIMPTDINPREHEIIGEQPLAMMVSGQFPNAYQGTSMPSWPGQNDSMAAAITEETLIEAPGKLLLYGCGEMFSDQILGAAGNALLMLNSVDALVLGDDLINVRTKLMTQRFIQETSATAKMFWRFFVIILLPVILVAIGIARYMMRRKRREIYQRLVEQAG
ncbi:MAG: ABC transporter permease subunit [candidate division Zixibacteria bacterium]|nr:ABC transporter permease subunit [candidate division Zixibacteria bacterium]